MKKLLLCLLLIIPISYVNATGINFSKNTLTLKEGTTTSFNIIAVSCAGRVDITSSNNEVINLSTNKEFLDNNQVIVKVTGKKPGTATISVKLTDVASYSLEELGGTKEIVVNVLEDPNANTNVVNPVNNSEMNVTKFEIVGYNIDFDINTREYSIKVDESTKEIYLLIEGNNFTSSVSGEINIENTDKINVTLKNDSESREYVINIIKGNIPLIEEKSNNIVPYIIIGFITLDIILLIVVIIRKKKINNMG